MVKKNQQFIGFSTRTYLGASVIINRGYRHRNNVVTVVIERNIALETAFSRVGTYASRSGA